MKAIRLTTEGLRSPVGISVLEPRISWNCMGGIRQTAYQIIARDMDSNEIIWDSEKVLSNKMTYIEWQGKKGTSRERIAWKVRLWDEEDRIGEWSEEATFELGLSKEDWCAKWITGDYTPAKRANQAFQYIQKPKKRYPVDCFKKTIYIDKSVVKARIYASACGLYEISVNGKKAGDFCLAPGITDYRKRVQAQTIDATALFATRGEHEISILLADGWYRGSVGGWGLLDQYGIQTKVIAQFELVYKDGTKDIFGTDDSFYWSNDGAILFADNKDGEVIDANRTPSYAGRARVTNHNVLPVPSNNVPMLEKERFIPAISKSPSGKVILDMGQNFAGYIAFSVDAKKGQKLFLRFGEVLKNGELTQDNIQLVMKDRVTPKQLVSYICKNGRNEYKTRFAIFGYQYVEVTGDQELIERILDHKAEFEGIAVYSDLERTGFFTSSNELLNRLVEAAVWSAKSNSADLPTDCPTRERHGWTGDAQIFFKSASYLFDYRTFARKYLNDMYDWQKKNGNLPQIVPDGGADFFMGTMNGSSGWSDAGIIIPHRFAKIFQDEKILEDYYEGMKHFAQFMERRCGKRQLLSRKATVTGENKKYLVNCGPSYGEWAEPEDVFMNNWTEQVFPHPEVSTAYSSYVFSLMAEIAGKCGRNEDEEEFRRFSNGCKKAYQELITTPEFSMDSDRQALLVRPLYLKLLTKSQEEFAKKRLIQAMENYGWRLGTGFLSTPFILNVLMDIDIEAAYKLLENEEIPGWLSMPKQGASTIWESWEGPDSQNGLNIGSLNHYSKGAVVEWLFEKMCGIEIQSNNEFTITPHPGGHFTNAKATYISVYGEVVSEFVKTKEGYRYYFEIPANTTASVKLLDGRERILEPGKHEL